MATAGSVPGARESAISWTDSAGNFWLFGGTYTAVNGDKIKCTPMRNRAGTDPKRVNVVAQVPRGRQRPK